eukprot:SAG31_NODE_12879_length_909_cov_1.529630_1_plen_173_part_00
MKDVTIGVVSMESLVGEVDFNLETMESFMSDARAADVDLCCFPECCIGGYDVTERGPLAPQCIEPIPGPITDHCCALAHKYGIWILAGMLERDESGAVFNTQIVCTSAGTLAGAYRKIQPGISELPSFGAGSELPIFQHPKVCFGIQICCEPFILLYYYQVLFILYWHPDML